MMQLVNIDTFNPNMVYIDLQRYATPVQPTPDNSQPYVLPLIETMQRILVSCLSLVFVKSFSETYDEIPEQYPKIYNVTDSKKAVEHDWGMGAFGDWTQRQSQFDESGLYYLESWSGQNLHT